jgi:hypothetical protein
LELKTEMGGCNHLPVGVSFLRPLSKFLTFSRFHRNLSFSFNPLRPCGDSVTTRIGKE